MCPTKQMVVILEFVGITGKDSNCNQIVIAFFMIVTKDLHIDSRIIYLEFRETFDHIQCLDSILRILGLE